MNRMKIVFTDTKTVTSGDSTLLDRFKDFGEVVMFDNLDSSLVASYASDADILVCNKTVITADTISKMPNLKLITLLATGYNNIDIKAASERGITVCNAGEYSTSSVAQQVFAYMLYYTNNVASFDKRVKDGKWENSDIFCILDNSMQELEGKTIGIFGFGSIGRRVARIAKAFGMNVIATTRTIKDNDVEYVEFDELLTRSDFITVHCPLTDDTKEVFNKQAFEKCKSNCIFINTSRGGTVNEEALADALNSGKIAGAAVDVLQKEPMAGDCPLKNAKNIIFTPHVAWAPVETRERLINIVYNNIKGFIEGKIVNKVN